MPTVDKTASISIKQGLFPTYHGVRNMPPTAGGRAAARCTQDAAVQHDQMLKSTVHVLMKW
jgi:hypothetical protein